MKYAVWLLLGVTMMLYGCSTVPITGRKQLKIVSDAQLLAPSAQSYQEVIKKGPLSTNQAQVEQIRRAGQRIARAVEQYLQDQGQSGLIDGFAWEFNLIEEDVPNAWCMPGGKVAFYTGILPYTMDETGIAVVMGHEVAHAIAGHSAERVTNQMLQQYGGSAVSMLAKSSDYYGAIMQAYGLTTQYAGILPYSRLHESEADRLGLVFMAMAGYNPEAAVGFWQRMAAKGQSTPAFLSTHPSDEARIRALRECMPEALQHYRP